jgi:putative transposase
MFNIYRGFCCWNFQVSRQSGFAFLCSEIKRVRVVRRADGDYAQFCIAVERTEQFIPTGKAIGIDVGLNHFYTDSDGNTIPNPRYLCKSKKSLKRLQKGISGKKKGSSNRKKAIDKLGRKHLYVSRQRKDFAIKTTPGAVK